MRRLGVIFVLLAATLVAAVPAHAAGKRRAPQGFYGVMWNRAATEVPKELHDAEFALMARSGVESVRTVFSWAAAQPAPGQPPSMIETDRVVALAAARHIELLPIVLYTPGWASRYPGRRGSPPTSPADYAAYLSALVARYGPNGTFWSENPALPRTPIRAWQVWNEPHLEDYWLTEGGPWAPSYTALLKASAKAIRRGDRRATVVTAGLASFPWTYLKAIYKNGGRGSFDAVAMNLFTSSPQNVIRGVRLVRRELRSHGDRRKKVWITEGTWPASKGRAPGSTRASWQRKWETTPRGMAARLRGLYALAVKGRRREGIGRVFWYTWATAYHGDDLFDYGGLLTFDGQAFTPNPALRAYTASARRFQGCVKTSAGRCR